MRKDNQQYLLNCFLYDKNNWGLWKKTSQSLLNVKEEKEFLEKNYSKELTYLSFTLLDFERANYYNEVFKDSLK